ncbi:hypothetical protein ACFY71_37205 [Streptomyces cinerochromogenes]|uniref:hypothetical protein n=1 Tax=Streptomyces cinerochromogenes TaxID=66422 RepID=UPI003675A853
MSQAQVLAAANRKGALVDPAEGRANIAEEYVYGFNWSVRRDQSTAGWRPQGVTTAYDDAGAGSTLLVSWYDLGGAQEQGMRVSFVDWSPAGPPRYRHVLLVEPYRNADGLYTYGPVRIHAGGIAAYNGYLYVADTYNGLRVFDLSTILVAGNDRPTWVGLHGNGDAGDYYSYGYKYVLPQVGAYDNVGLRLRFSAVSVDRTTSPHSLLVCEYDQDGTIGYNSDFRGRPNNSRKPKLVRWPLSPGWSDATGSLVANEVWEVGRRQMQGAASVNGTYYLSVSAGQTRRGQLMSWKPDGGAPARQSRLSTGPEDLSYHGSEKVMWTVGEWEDFRYVYAVDPTA